jgi:predicted nuclease of predicted toxin-antitoxin system
MILWVDAQLSPHLAPWITENLGIIEAYSARWLGYRDAPDEQIFAAARQADAVVLTKDRDFPDLLERHGPPPRVIWITMGNTTNARMREVLARLLPEALGLLSKGEPLVELGDRQ